MKHLCTGILLTLFVWTAVPSSAQQSLFKPFAGLRVIQTEHFDIIFPKESEPSARLLASYADRVYDHVSSLLGIEVPGRIPVTFTPHTDMFNGYYDFLPIPRIMLFDTPMNLEWTSEADNLESLFLHELTHAVSLNSRSPGFRILHRIFGNIMTPTIITAPLFMVEGVTVSFESLSGFARTNDPLIKQKLRQAVYEGKFLTPFQASGVYDIPGQESMIYEYGGPFSAWLQQTYGMEKYAELWQAMGGEYYRVSLLVYKEGFYDIFKRVYNLDFLDTWKAFADTMSLDGLEENSDVVLPVRHRFFSERESFIDALAARGNSLYFLNEGKVCVYDTRTERTRSFNTGSVYSFDLDISADNTKILLSGYRFNSADRAVATVTELRTNSGLRTGRSIRGLARARYFRDGVIGLSPELHNTCIAYQEFNGKKEILVRGNENFVFSGPQAVDNERIVFVASRHGVRELWLYNYVSRELFRIEDDTLNGNEHWPHMRGLSVSGGKLFFSHNADDRMYKLASIDLETMQAVYSDRDFSGGVSIPVEADGAVYYRGSFFSRDTLLRFPEPADALTGTQTSLQLVKLDTNNFDIITDENNEPTVGVAAPDAPDDSSLLTAHSSLLTDNPPLLIPVPYDTHLPPYSGPSKPYFGIRYMNPLLFWFPQLLIRAGDAARNDWGISLDGVGFITWMADAADRNLITILAYADIPFKMAYIDHISWQNTTLGFPVQVAFSDGVLEAGGDFFRYTSVNLAAGLVWSMGGWVNAFSPGAGYIRIADDDNSRESAYYWKETGSFFLVQANYTLSNLRQQPNEIFGTGLTLEIGGVSIVNFFEPRAEGVFKASVETRFPMELTLFGGYDNFGMDLHGNSLLYTDRPLAAHTLTEYPHPEDLDLTWLAGGTASLGIFSLEIQKHISHLYFNRFFGILSVGNVLYDSKGHPDASGIAIYDDLRLIQSLRLKLAMKVSVLPFIKRPVSIEPYFLGSWKFSNTITRKENPMATGLGVDEYPDWFFGAGFNIRF